MKKVFLSVVIPCYNEERNLRIGALEKVAHYLAHQHYLWEAIIVDDGSRDASREIVTEFIREHKGFSLLKITHQGKAAAVTAGVFKSKGSVILFTDLDQATPIDQIEKLLPYISRGFEVVIGSRNSKRAGAPFFRKAMATGFMLIRNIVLDLGIRDTQCGFKAFSKNAASDIFSRLQVFNRNRTAYGSTVTAGFDVELLYLAKRIGYKIAEVDVDWHYQETRHVNPVKDSLESLSDLVKIRLNSLRGVY